MLVAEKMLLVLVIYLTDYIPFLPIHLIHIDYIYKIIKSLYE